MNDELDILIINYLDNNLDSKEKNAFEKRMSNDQTISAKVDQYKLIKKGVQVFAKNEMRVELSAVQNKVLKAKTVKNYKPSINPNGFSFSAFIIKSILFLLTTTIVLIYFNLLPFNNKYIEKINKKIHTIEIIKQDTIWIKSDQLGNGDTIEIKNKEDIRKIQNSRGK